MSITQRIGIVSICILLVFGVALGAAACGGEENDTADDTSADSTETTGEASETTEGSTEDTTDQTWDEPIELTFAGLWPPDHPFSKATELWIDKIEEETDGQVTIEPFWGAALYESRDAATELAAGVADIGGFSGAYAAKGFEFEKAMRMAFWGVDDPELGRRVYDEVRAKYPEIDAEFEDAELKVMAYASIPAYQLLSVDQPVRNQEDFKGLVIKGSGDLADLASALGGEGVGIGMGETYTALQKSTIDGAFAPYETLKSFRFAEVVGYVTELNIGAAPSGHWGMNMDTWNSLPPDVQQVFEDNVEWFGLKLEEMLRAQEEEALALADENDVEVIRPSEGEVEEIYDEVDRLQREKMAQLDEQGLPGTEVYEEIRRLIEEYGD